MKEITDRIGLKHMSDKMSDTNKITISGIRESMHLKFDVPGFAKKNKGPHFRILKLNNKITVKEYRFTKGCFKLTKNHLEIDIDKILYNVEKEKIRIERCLKDKAAFDFKLQLMNIRFQEWFENYENKYVEPFIDELVKEYSMKAGVSGLNIPKNISLSFDTKDKTCSVYIVNSRYNYEKAIEKDFDNFRFRIQVTYSPSNGKLAFWKNCRVVKFCEFKDFDKTLNEMYARTKQLYHERETNGK
jgi:hypothetical protein